MTLFFLGGLNTRTCVLGFLFRCHYFCDRAHTLWDLADDGFQLIKITLDIQNGIHDTWTINIISQEKETLKPYIPFHIFFFLLNNVYCSCIMDIVSADNNIMLTIFSFGPFFSRLVPLIFFHWVVSSITSTAAANIRMAWDCKGRTTSSMKGESELMLTL